MDFKLNGRDDDSQLKKALELSKKEMKKKEEVIELDFDDEE